MKSKTIAQCFGFLAIFLSICLVGEFLFAIFTKRTLQSFHKSFPLVTFPALIEKIKTAANPSAQVDQEPITRAHITLKNGRKIDGEKISEDSREIVLKIDGSAIGFSRSEISRIEYSEETL